MSYMSTFLKLAIHQIRHQIRPHIKLAVSLVIEYGHANFPRAVMSDVYDVECPYPS